VNSKFQLGGEFFRLIYPHIREIHLTCEDALWRTYGLRSVIRLIDRTWNTALELNSGSADGSLVTLKVTASTLSRSVCPFRELSYPVIAKPVGVFPVKYVPQAKYSSTPLSVHILPNERFFRVTLPNDESGIEADVTL